MPHGSPSVLVIRLDAIGDALALTPLLAALGERGVLVDLVLRPENAGIFSRRAARHAIVASDVRQRSDDAANRAAVASLGSTLRGNGYTHVLVATEDPAGYRLAGAAGAAVRAGFTNGLGKPLKTLWARRFINQSVYRSAGQDRRAPHECAVLFALGRTLLGNDRPSRDTALLRPLVIDEEPAPDERTAVQITDKWERLGIGVESVVDMLHLAAAFGEMRLLCAQSERAYGERIERAFAQPVEYFGDLASWKAAIASAPAIVTPDSGALHVAGMVGTPTVAVFPPSRDFALQVARWSPWAAPHRIVRADAGWPSRVPDALAQLL